VRLPCFPLRLILTERRFWTPLKVTTGSIGDNGSVVGIASGDGVQVLLATAQQPEELFTESGVTPLGGNDIYLAVVDITNPNVVQLTPTDNSTDIRLDSSLEIQFNEGVKQGSGSVTIYQASDNSIVETIAITSGQINVSNDTVTIDPTSSLTPGTAYYVQISAGAIEDLAGNDFAGITDTSTWNFTTTNTGGTIVSKVLINEFYRGGDLGTGDEWIEVLLTEDLTAAELNGFFIGDSTSSTAAKFSGYQFTNMGNIAQTFEAGTLIAIGGNGAFTQDITYNPAGGDWNILLNTTGSFLTSNGSSGDLAGTDVVYVDTNGTNGNTAISTDGFAVNYDSTPGTLGANANVTIAAPSNNFGVVLTSDLAGATTAGNWTTSVAPANLTLGNPNGGNNTTYIDSLRNAGSSSELDLSTYVRIGRYDLPVPARTVNPPAGSELALEVSAITYNPTTNTLFVLGDEGTAIVEINKQGQLVSSMTLTDGDFADPEGLTYVGSGSQFVLVEERLRQANLFTYTAGGTLSRANVQSVKLGTTVGNIGLEGASYDPVSSGYIFVKEVDPQGIFQTTIDFGAGTASNGSPATENSTNLFDPALLSLTDIADVFALANSTFVTGATANNLLVLGQEDGKLVEVDRSGTVLSELVITADPGNPLTVTDHGFEGVTLDNNGLLYLTSERGGGDVDHPQVWVYAPAAYTFNNAAPVAVSVANATTTLLESTNTTNAIKLGNIIVSDDSLGTNTLSVSGTGSEKFEIVGNALFLKAGATLDFATQSNYALTIAVDDSTLGSTPDVTTSFNLAITDTQVSASPLIVSEVAPWSSGNSSLGADWFEVTNTGANAIDLTGWKIDDDSASFASGSALSGVTSIAPNQSVIFVEGTAATTTAFINLWFGGTAPNGFAIGTYGGPGLGTGGDAINLFDAAGTFVTGVSFDVSPAVSPFATFENPNGFTAISSLSNLSTSGNNGAFSVIDGGEGVVLTGSPGVIAGTPATPTLVGIVATGATASENNLAPGEFTILRTGDTTAALDVTYSIRGQSGDAVNGTDYNAIHATTVTIAAGQSQVKIAITPIDDSALESTESIVLTLTDTAAYDVQANVATATVTIEDNDTALADFNLQVTEIWPGNSVGTNLTADWFEITNTGTEAWVSGGEPDLYYDDESQAPAEADLINGLVQLDPGETAIVVIGNETDAQTFRTVWGSVIDLTGVEVGYTDGAGLGANGDGVSLFVGLPGTGAVPVDFETYPTGSSGRSCDVELAVFSVAGTSGAVATAVNNQGQAAIGSPGDGTAITKIHAIQGTADQNLLDDQIVTIEAIVVGDFQDGDSDASRNLRGFYVQEENADADGDAATSEGIFIFENGNFITDVNVGDKVQITGTVDEFFGETQIDTITNITIISSGNPLPTAANITLPAADTTLSQGGTPQPDLEAFEGMLVNFTDTLTITEMFNLDRFNEIRLSQGDRPQQFTQFNDADVAGYDAHREEVGARTITYDDGLSVQNALIGNLDGFGPTFSTASDIRMGDTIDNLTGVLSYQWAGNSASGATWRVRSTVNGENTFNKVNDRPETPEEVGGSLKVTGFNVLNYFKTIDTIQEGSGSDNPADNTAVGQDPRGADSTAEFDRQTEKLVTALLAIDADVLGLVELENDFLAGSSGNAIEYLVDQLNAATAAGTYAWVDPGTQFVGGDAIAVGLIYKPSAVSLVGDVAILDTPAFLDPNSTGQDRNRPAVAQTFEDLATGETFTAVVNHLKSKGASELTDTTSPDYDQNDGQGFWNDTRTKSAQALVDWLDTNPTGVNDSDYLLLGDFNAYAQEDPVKVLEEAGYVNLASQFSGGTATSYVFDGQTGTLDYAFASASLAQQVTGATEWGINSDEADAIDYNLDFGRDAAIFDGTTPYRTSDHDPVIVGLNLSSISITALDANKAEGNSGITPFTFTVTRSGDLSTTVSVDYTVEGAIITAVVDGDLSASADDFAPSFPLTGTIAFAAGEASKIFTVEVAGDTTPEIEGDFPSQDVFVVSLSNPSGGVSLGEATFATGFILNDDQPTQPPIVVGTPEDDDVTIASGGNNLIFTGAGKDEVDILPIDGTVGSNRIFTGSNNDIIFVADGDRAFGGSGDDDFYAIGASGYRLSGGAGNDEFFLGVGGRALGGDGDDTFTVAEDGGNLLSGGAGSDRFNILTDTPTLFTTPNTIVDFTVGTDTLGILGQGESFGFNNLTLEGNEIKVGDNTIAILQGVETNTLTANDFSF